MLRISESKKWTINVIQFFYSSPQKSVVRHVSYVTDLSYWKLHRKNDTVWGILIEGFWILSLRQPVVSGPHLRTWAGCRAEIWKGKGDDSLGGEIAENRAVNCSKNSHNFFHWPSIWTSSTSKESWEKTLSFRA